MCSKTVPKLRLLSVLRTWGLSLYHATLLPISVPTARPDLDRHDWRLRSINHNWRHAKSRLHSERDDLLTRIRRSSIGVTPCSILSISLMNRCSILRHSIHWTCLVNASNASACTQSPCRIESFLIKWELYGRRKVHRRGRHRQLRLP